MWIWKKKPKQRYVCPCCSRPFSDWFWWPGKGLYCWPCRKTYDVIITLDMAKAMAGERMTLNDVICVMKN